VKGQTGKGKHGLTAVSSRREAISKVLTKCPVERWISTAELLRFLLIHLRELLEGYPDGRVLVIGAYIDQVETIATEIGARADL
jgi:hypothetical protein